jgi:alpha/beta superfamily hydrolase
MPEVLVPPVRPSLVLGVALTVLAASTASAQRKQAQATDYSAPPGAPYRAISVTVPTPMGHTLAGTLTLPNEASKAHPVAAVVTISGTGPQDRDEFLGFGNYRPFRQFADSLGRRGIAVLRMDDRGVGQSKGRFKGATPIDFVKDIRAGLAYLRTRAEIDPKRLALLGHSEGAIDAPMVALEEPSLKALVLLAGQAHSLHGALKFQLENMIRHDTTLTPARRDSAVAHVQDKIDSLTRTDPYMKFMDGYDPSPTARKVSKPAILILTGETDRQADPKQVDDWVAAFKASGNPDVTGRVLPGLNHLFVPDPDGFPGGYAKLPQPLAVDRSVVGMVVDWLSQRLR